MDEQLTISTPEQVAFHYEMAGIGSRFVASLLDHLILGVALLLVYCAASSLFGAGVVLSGPSGENGTAGLYAILAVIIIVEFLIFWGYFVLFELVWHGQTPGKRAGKLRVIRRDGQPVHAGEVLVRNLLRIVDFLPGFYGIGLVTMFIDKDARRLGDLAAGTIVVREGEQIRLRDVQVPPAAPSAYGDPAAYDTPAYYGQQQVGQTYQPYASYGQQGQDENSSGSYGQPPPATPRYDPLPGISLRDVTQDDYRLIREMLQRASRGELGRDRAEDLAQRLAFGVAGRMGQDFKEWHRQGWDPLVFLQSVLTAKEARE
jgi:uncharacterized RDD family membrane protein YckC